MRFYINETLQYTEDWLATDRLLVVVGVVVRVVVDVVVGVVVGDVVGIVVDIVVVSCTSLVTWFAREITGDMRHFSLVNTE